ncbi:MAG: phosphoribosylamine--glycine ligase [Spirochaetaceae bacterium]|jgi:phosphoribosylamine--glycine ligase|nr:phosphoribosylamine--glycine ligase [Spirochaetaceae bacterium]
MKALVAGSGGREHAIAWALAKSPQVSQVVCVPGNGGTAGEPKCVNVPARDGEDFDGAVCRIARRESCDFAVIGPEDPLARGLADRLRGEGIPVAGPGKDAARLESSKDFAKSFMARHGVASARSRTFLSASEARSYVETLAPPVVIKADGLAAGKGVVVAPDKETALGALTRFMEEGALGDAGRKILVEDFLSGPEYSVLAAVSVSRQKNTASILPFLPARDHKRLLTGNRGPNTGGMGAVCPVPDVTEAALEEFHRAILQPTLGGLVAEGIDYEGFIFFGVILTGGGSKLLEYNARLGDPETQAVLPLMESDFASLCLALIGGGLGDFKLSWKKGAVCAPVAVSGGYPGAYKTGFPIDLGDVPGGAKIFVSGARQQDGGLVTAGGRVLAASAWGREPEEARELAYRTLRGVRFKDLYFRTDIGTAPRV